MSNDQPADQLVLVASLTGLVGGVAGLASLLWTVVWSVTLRPRARWSLNRITAKFTHQMPAGPGGEPGATITLDPPDVTFVFRNIGTLAADDAHIWVRGGGWEGWSEFPPTGRERVEPGGELTITISARVRDGVGAGRKYPSGDDTLFDLRHARARIKWRRFTLGNACRRFNLDRAQRRVPFV